MTDAQARREEAQQAKQREGLELVAKARGEIAEDREKVVERRRRWRADHEGKPHVVVGCMCDRFDSQKGGRGNKLTDRFTTKTQGTLRANAELQEYRAELRRHAAEEDAKVNTTTNVWSLAWSRGVFFFRVGER
jgi:hypothetical protein